MRKFLSILLFCIIAFGLCACGGDVSNVQVADYSSSIYTDAEIGAAIDVTINYFKREFSGCTLLELAYIGDAKLAGYQDFADRNNADDVIVFVSSFEVDASGGDGSLNPNDTYTGWKWILARNNGGAWKHVDHGYG